MTTPWPPPEDGGPVWPRTTGTALADRPMLDGAPQWVHRAASLSHEVAWLDWAGGWAVDASTPLGPVIDYRTRCDCCRHELGRLIYAWTDGGVYCGLRCLDLAIHTCPDCGGDTRVQSDPALGPVACSHGWWS